MELLFLTQPLLEKVNKQFPQADEFRFTTRFQGGSLLIVEWFFRLYYFSKGEIVILVKILLKFKGMKNQNQVDKYKSEGQKIEKK